jgi:hypothetical protein
MWLPVGYSTCDGSRDEKISKAGATLSMALEFVARDACSREYVLNVG